MSIRLLDHLICPLEEGLRDRETEGLGGLEVDDELELTAIASKLLQFPCFVQPRSERLSSAGTRSIPGGDRMKTFQNPRAWWIVVSGLALAALLAVCPPAVSAQGKKSTAPAAKVDLNAATEKELEDLPGVGPATAKRIMAGRPYGSVTDLSKAGVPAKTIEKITPLVSVGAAAGTATAPAPAATTPAATPPTKSSSPSAAKATESAKSSAIQGQVPPAKGMVWVNTKSKVFHYEGDRWYGKTKEGKFMTEADAVKAGYHASKEGTAKKDGGG